ncbi:gluconokinase [Neolewinella antarctica]|uniref:Gluconokinase n=1 Tax=Neolewinella antarctica TaxID=442734 RepID=A0ABX0XAQ8_9BACT|nr:gluconokinase [Neolewinella antarctica]NJC26024.1 gluconokinase [Neolewinella antarctica]
MVSKSGDQFFVGVDVGTTSVKVCAFDGTGKMVTESIEAYPLDHPEPGAATQSPRKILASCGRALQRTVAETPGKIAAIGLSCPMHSVLLYNENEGFDDTIYTWADNRGQAVMDQLSPELRERLHYLTGTPVHPMSPLVKIRWLMEFRPEKMAWATHIYGLKELLTSAWATETLLDEQLASATGLYDTERGQWCPEAQLAAVPVPKTAFEQNGWKFQLATVKPATHRLHWRPEIAEAFGVTDVPLFLGGSDGCLANLGSGITEPGQVAVTIGTSAAVRATHRTARVDPARKLFNYRIDARTFAIGGASNNGGKVIEYWQQLLRADFPDVASFIDAAFTVKKADCPVLEPYLYGERAPLWDATASGALRGLRGHHRPAHVARAVLEGVTDNVAAILHDLEAAVGEAKVIEASGGFTRSPEWVALLGERSGREVVIADTPQASAFGAALVAKRGLLLSNLENL